MTYIFKYVSQCATVGRVFLLSPRSRIQAVSDVLPLHLSSRGLPFLLVTAALVLSVISCQETGILTRHHIAPTKFASPVSDNLPETTSSSNSYNTVREPQFYPLAVQSSQELISQLKEFKLWDGVQADVPPVLLNSFPADLKQIDVDIKKKTFVRALLPAVMLVQAEVRQERQELLHIIDEIGEPASLTFSQSHTDWQEGISQTQALFIKALCKKYRTQQATELLARVNVLPASLILAQAALESSWGSSRFSIQANNLFGMWTWGKKGLVPAQREAGKSHKIAIYDSILDSVRSYLLTINRLGAYSELRDIRSSTMDSGAIAEGLINYSERKEYYVSSLKKLMKHNNLVIFDKCRLALTVKIKRARA